MVKVVRTNFAPKLKGPLLSAKFHLDWCNVLPLRSEKPITGRAALRADPAGNDTSGHNTHWSNTLKVKW